jgi:flagellar hook protein FlgE
MGSAISIGQSGLAASSKQMEVIANNLANSNTVGFKANTTLFSTMMSQGLSSYGFLSAGQGVQVSGLPTQFVQGSFESTGNVTDMAIDGEGYFMVKDAAGVQWYTRAGAFHLNTDNMLVDGKGFKLQGYAYSNVGTTSTATFETVPTDISLPRSKDATATTEVNFGANLSENTAGGGKFNISQSVYDSKGGVHTLSFAFTKSTVTSNSEWTCATTFDGTATGLTTQSIVFNPDGSLKTPSADVLVLIDDNIQAIKDSLKGATIGNSSKQITWTVSDTTQKLTGYASQSVIRSTSADGYASGDLRSLVIDTGGLISGVYTNGQTMELYKLSLANFTDQSQLMRNGNYFSETTTSGQPSINPAGTSGLGAIQSNSLEVSNTDVSKEFINMITAQRAYQANAKVITTADQMLTTLMNVKQ